MRTFILSLLLILIPLATTWADEFGDFRIPEHSVYLVTGSFNGSSQSDLTNNSSDSYRDWRYSGEFTADGYYLWDSDPLRASITFNGNLKGLLRSSRSHSPADPVSFDRKEDRDLNETSEYWYVRGETRHYPWTFPVGLMLEAMGTATYQQDWFTNYLHESGFGRDYQRHQNIETWDYRYHVGGTTAIGVGRVRDASDVYVVDILQERLLQTGALNRALSSAAHTKLAQLFYTHKSFSTVHDRAQKLFWQEVERILREDGALRDTGLDAYDVYRFTEPYFGASGYSDAYKGQPIVTTFQREKGFFAGLSVQANHSDNISRQWVREHNVNYDADTLTSDAAFDYSSHSHDFYDDYCLGPMAEYHLPLGMRWQFDILSEVMFPLKSDQEGLSTQTHLNVQYILADRWWAEGTFRHMRDNIHPKDNGLGRYADSWSVRTGLSLGYYIEDRLTAQISFSQNQNGAQFAGFAYHTGHLYSRSTTVEIGLSYNFLGRLRIPGLGIDSPQAPLPSGGNWFR